MFTLRQGIQTQTADCPPEVFSPWGREMSDHIKVHVRGHGWGKPRGPGSPKEANQTQEDGGGEKGCKDRDFQKKK